MKQLHRKDLFGWSVFDTERNLDFHSVLWVRDGGNVLIDPLPLSEHDHGHLQRLGGADLIVITNSDHCRDAEHIASETGAMLCGPAAEEDTFPLSCNRWLMIMRRSSRSDAYELKAQTPGSLPGLEFHLSRRLTVQSRDWLCEIVCVQAYRKVGLRINVDGGAGNRGGVWQVKKAGR